MTDQRKLFETAVIDRLKESGFLEVEIRVECLARCDDGYQDEVINAGWHYWNAAIAAQPSPETKSVLGSIDRPEALAPHSEAIGESIIEVGAAERREVIESGLAPFAEDLLPPLITERGGIAFHNGLRTEARAQASPSRREIGDNAHVEQMPEKETPEAPERNTALPIVKSVCQHCQRITVVPAAIIKAAMQPPENQVLHRNELASCYLSVEASPYFPEIETADVSEKHNFTIRHLRELRETLDILLKQNLDQSRIKVAVLDVIEEIGVVLVLHPIMPSAGSLGHEEDQYIAAHIPTPVNAHLDTPPSTNAGMLLETYDGLHRESAQDFSGLVGDFKSSTVNNTAVGNQLANYLASGANGLFIGKFVGEKFGPVIVLFENTCGSDVVEIPGHASSLQLPAHNFAELIVFPSHQQSAPQTRRGGRSANGGIRPSGVTHEGVGCDFPPINNGTLVGHASADVNAPGSTNSEQSSATLSVESPSAGHNLVESLHQSESDIFPQQNHGNALYENSEAGRVLDNAPSALGFLDSAVAHPLGISDHQASRRERFERRPAPVRPGTSLQPNEIHGSTEMESSKPTSSPSHENLGDDR